MAVTTGAIFNSLSFGGVNSADYGIYITGEAVYNAPKRAVEMVSVPGRNGAIAIDQGHWENIEVTYPAGTFGMTEAEFRTAVSDFRNAIVSQIGYQRLTDTYHPDEYRLALYVEGLEVEPAPRQQAGEFELKFNCKPQRWLIDGETLVTVSDGDTLTNPTQYDAGPLLAVEGYGTISFNGYTIELNDNVLGDIELIDSAVSFSGLSGEIIFSEEYVNNGDPITVGVGFTERIFCSAVSKIISKTYTPPSTGAVSITDKDSTGNAYLETTGQSFSFVAGTDSAQTDTAQVVMTYQRLGLVTVYNCTIDIDYTFSYDASEHKLTYGTEYTFTCSSGYNDFRKNNPSGGSFNSISATSSVSTLGHPTYIDCDLGEAYKIENDQFLSLNTYIDLGSDLPTLASGSNTVTFDNTITDFKIYPRWWQL